MIEKDEELEESMPSGLSNKKMLTGMYQNWFLDYASYVILDRAVPHIYDGLKPVQRRILHSMKRMEDGRYNKVANIVGHTMQFHPHGDSSIGNALVQLGQKNYLIDTQGNWGNVLTGDSAAAPRYIEARLSPFALVVFSKRVVLCGEDSKAHVFTSRTRIGHGDGISVYNTNRPTAVVEVLDPMVLSSKVKEVCDCVCKEPSTVQIPSYIRELFDEELVLSGDQRRLFVTLGQFSIVRLERDAQLVVPVLDSAIPCRECCDAPGATEDPCEMFSRIPFPAQQFASTACTDGSCKPEGPLYRTTAD